MSETNFHGVFPYLVSPIRDSGEVDDEVLGRLCDDLIAAMELQLRLWNLNQAFAKHNLAACIKGGLQLQGYPVGAL